MRGEHLTISLEFPNFDANVHRYSQYSHLLAPIYTLNFALIVSVIVKDVVGPFNKELELIIFEYCFDDKIEDLYLNLSAQWQGFRRFCPSLAHP